MPKMTLLEMTVDILNDMDSDSVSSISDTLESTQVAQIVKTTYFDILSEYGIPGTGALFELSAFGDTTNPTKLQVPDTITEFYWIKYNKVIDVSDPPNYEDCTYLNPEDFLTRTNQRDSDDSTVDLITVNGADILIRNDTPPTYWTTFDDAIIIMDSYESDVESSLQASKTQSYGLQEPTWGGTDGYIPTLPSNLFPLFLSEAKAQCFAKLKQEINPKEEQRARRNRIRAQSIKRRGTQTRAISSIDYGRSSRK